MYHITSIDFDISGTGVVNSSIKGEETILDSDIVIVNPSGIAKILELGLTDGSISRLTPYSFRQYSERMKALRKEMTTLLDQGRIVVAFLSPVQKYFTLNNLSKRVYLSNYDFLPYSLAGIVEDIQAGKGLASGYLKLGKKKSDFDSLFHALKKDFRYEAYIDRDYRTEDYPERNFIFNRSGKPVGTIAKHGSGSFVLLPQLKEKNDAKFVSAVCQAAKSYFQNDSKTPAPAWLNSFTLPGEKRLRENLEENRAKMKMLLEEEKELLGRVEEISALKGLLYETGKRLEGLVKEAFLLLGFEVTERDTGTEEHDILFSSSEGKGIAEVEGKDDSWINVAKLDQLSRAVDEDFDLTEAYARGVLVGNHFRLRKPEDRKEAFTPKAITVAKRKRFALLNTVELFSAVKYILNHPEDASFREEARNAILQTEGEEVSFIGLMESNLH